MVHTVGHMVVVHTVGHMVVVHTVGHMVVVHTVGHMVVVHTVHVHVYRLVDHYHSPWHAVLRLGRHLERCTAGPAHRWCSGSGAFHTPRGASQSLREALGEPLSTPDHRGCCHTVFLYRNTCVCVLHIPEGYSSVAVPTHLSLPACW